MGAVCDGKVVLRPREAIGSWVGTIGPKVWPPCEPWRCRVRQVTRVNVDVSALNLIDLRLDQPFRRKSVLIGVRLRVAEVRGITGVNSRMEEHQLNVWVLGFDEAGHLRNVMFIFARVRSPAEITATLEHLVVGLKETIGSMVLTS